MRFESLPLHKVVPPIDPHRVSIDDQELHELMTSIKAVGLINPIYVRPIGDTFEVIAGHRRLRAHQLLGLSHIKTFVREEGDPNHDEAVRFAENFERVNLSPMEEARAIDIAQREAQMNTEQIARVVNRSQAWVVQRLALLELPDDLARLVHLKQLGIASALELVKVSDEEHRAYLLRYTIDSGASTQIVRDWVRQWEFAKATGSADSAPRPSMPLPGQPVIIQMPCYVCGTPHEHTLMRILRTCPECAQAIAGSALTHEHQPPATTTAASPAATA